MVFLYQKRAIYWRRLIIYLTFLILTLYKCVVCYTIVVCTFRGQSTIKVQEKSKFRIQFSLTLKPDFLANSDFLTKETCNNFKNGKSPRQKCEKQKHCLEAKQKMWFVVKVPKIENGGEGYEVRGWGVRGGRKSGLRVGGMTFLIGWWYEIHPQRGSFLLLW